MSQTRVVQLPDEFVKFVPVESIERLLWPVVESMGDSEAHFDWGSSKNKAYFEALVCRWRDSGKLKVFAAGGLGTLPIGSVRHGVLMRDDFTRLVSEEFNIEVGGADVPPPVSPHQCAKQATWVPVAQTMAREIIERQKNATVVCYPSQVAIADEIARNFRAATPMVLGAGRKPLTGAYIKRHALKGISSEQSRQLSTAIGRSKRGKN